MTACTATLLVRKALAAGYVCECSYDNIVDYSGTDETQIMDALGSCDEMTLRLYKDGFRTEAALIIMGLEPDERVADYTRHAEGQFIARTLEG